MNIGYRKHAQLVRLATQGTESTYYVQLATRLPSNSVQPFVVAPGRIEHGRLISTESTFCRSCHRGIFAPPPDSQPSGVSVPGIFEEQHRSEITRPAHERSCRSHACRRWAKRGAVLLARVIGLLPCKHTASLTFLITRIHVIHVPLSDVPSISAVCPRSAPRVCQAPPNFWTKNHL